MPRRVLTIQRLNADNPDDAFEYDLDEVQVVIQLSRWAEAQIESFYEELP